MNKKCTKRKTLTREEYKEKFDKLFAEMNYITQAGEKIIQCKDGYPEYWFISNKGYLFSAYGKTLKIIKPIFDKTGKANKEGNRAGKTWRYSTKYRKPANAALDRYDMGKMIAEHFGKNEFNSDEETEIHHIKKRLTFGEAEAQKCNRIDNLQMLPKSIHKELTHYASKTSDEIDKEFATKAEKAKCPIYQFTQEQLETFAIQAIRSCLAQGVEPIIYTTTLTDDLAQIEAEAHPIKEIKIS